ncbi:uncharacterized protein KD926_002541 [Aspergillus affinis]|uniref:uncharacterized protein n=1 Tax=Aspergillus affinis TaxID=1070780 RepID=UPI0022FF29ED|nr:uncharacterized protein KD926_002541 [Aspergillus affinis]KAI9035977.1 hypothetical protein KD926_002541 [Aspergillus affinis]
MYAVFLSDQLTVHCCGTHRFHSLDDPDRSSVSYLRSTPLALRVSYRELRLRKTPLYRSQARGQVLLLCTVLEDFGNNYCYTRKLARLARKIIYEIDKVAASVLQARNKDTDSPTSSGSVTGSGSVLNSTQDNAQVAQPSADSVSAMPEHHDPPINRPSVYEHRDQFRVPNIPEYEAEQYHAESFDDIYKFSDLSDMFEHFDPDFNLETVEFSLLQNPGLDAIYEVDFTAQII